MKITSDISRFLSGRSGLFIGCLCFFLVGMIGLIDFWTGLQVSVSILYLIPISLATWFSGKRPGVVLSLVSAAVWSIADLREREVHSYFMAPYWNSLVMLSIFVVVTYILSELRIALKREELSARIDFLTGIANKRSFTELIDFATREFARYGHIFSLAYVDVDNFKQVNDRHGHIAGDELLKSVPA